MPPNQVSGDAATTPGICSIRWRWESGRKLASPVACWTTSRLAPFPPEGSASIAASSDTSVTISTRTRMIEPVVRTVRVFLRKTFFQISRKYFIAVSRCRPPSARPRGGRPCRGGPSGAPETRPSGSWVTMTIVFLNSSFRRFKSTRISSADLASRSPVGSSATRIVGSDTMARAIATRCSCPPESWRG